MGQCSLERSRWTRVRAESGKGSLGLGMTRRGQIVRGSVGREGRERWCQSHLRRFRVGEVVGIWKWRGVRRTGCLHLIERWRERLSGAHAVYRNLVVGDSGSGVVGVDVVGWSGNGGRCGCLSHSKKLVRSVEERRKWVG